MKSNHPIDAAKRADAASAHAAPQDAGQLAAANTAPLPSCSAVMAQVNPVGLPSSYPGSAIFWFDFGLSVIPVLPGTKQTAVKWDQWLQQLSLRQVVSYWRANPTHEVGFIVGPSMVVLDADSPKAVAAMIEAERCFGVQPSMIVQTTRGEHHYFQKSPDLRCKTTCKIVGEVHDRIDVKTGRTMVILPPSPGKILTKFGGQHA